MEMRTSCAAGSGSLYNTILLGRVVLCQCNGDGDPDTQLQAGPAGKVYLILGFQPQPCFNGDGEQLPGVGETPIILLTIWLQA